MILCINSRSVFVILVALSDIALILITACLLTILTVTKSLLSVLFNTIPFGRYILKFVPSSKAAPSLGVTVISKIPVSLSTSAVIVASLR